jgi:hypothetical protein
MPKRMVEFGQYRAQRRLTGFAAAPAVPVQR